MRLQSEFEYFKAHQDELVELYEGRFVVIKGESVIAAYDSFADAVHQTAKTHEPGTFLIQRCEAGPEAYTQVFHSRVLGA